MAKAKPYKPLLHSWNVVRDSDTITIDAEGLEVSDGALIFRRGNLIDYAVADGAWRAVERLAPPQPPEEASHAV